MRAVVPERPLIVRNRFRFLGFARNHYGLVKAAGGKWGRTGRYNEGVCHLASSRNLPGWLAGTQECRPAAAEARIAKAATHRPATTVVGGDPRVVYEPLDVHKNSVVACLTLKVEARTFGTTTRQLVALSNWLGEMEVTHLAMESTGVYWKPIVNLLEDRFTVWVVNAHHIKAVPSAAEESQNRSVCS